MRGAGQRLGRADIVGMAHNIERDNVLGGRVGSGFWQEFDAEEGLADRWRCSAVEDAPEAGANHPLGRIAPASELIVWLPYRPLPDPVGNGGVPQVATSERRELAKRS